MQPEDIKGTTAVTFKVPMKTPVGDGYQIRVQSTKNSMLVGFSGKFQIVTSPLQCNACHCAWNGNPTQWKDQSKYNNIEQ